MTRSIHNSVGRVVAHANLADHSKKTLRQTLIQTLRSLPASAVRYQSEAVFRHVISSEAFRKSKNVSCYLSMQGEIDTTGIAREALRLGKSLYVPKIVSRKERRMEFLRVYSLEDLDSLPSGVWGIKEPDHDFEGKRRANVLDEDVEPLDLILVPGVAFDTSFSRLGHGRGYYDHFINTYCSSRPCPTLLALSLREQILPLGRIPMLEHDRRVDALATPDGIIHDSSAEMS